jgi:pimeloyl-ACP methyl ester carboxylesterase
MPAATVMKRFSHTIMLGKLLLLAGCSPLSTPTRKVNMSATPLPEEAAYIESKNGVRFSCSFVEFDGRGDFADFEQHRQARMTIQELAASQKILLVIYCHGWKNNPHSGDVVKFNLFLSQLAAAKPDYRVHGVYLGWRGNSFKPFVERGAGSPYDETEKLFGSPIVAKKWNRNFRATAWLPEQFTYWSRKRAAEHAVSGLPITRAVYTYAGTAKNASRSKGGNRVFVIGHSFGALMLEQSLLQGMVGGIMTDWSQLRGPPGPLDLPFDLVLLVNSAAPSIYAKQARDFLATDADRRDDAGVSDADAPVVISLTSTADKATGFLHRVGNLLAPLSPSMQRDYTERLLQVPTRGEKHEGVKQWEFYKRTPGHNPFLVNRVLRKDPSGEPNGVKNGEAFERNLDFTTASPDRFHVSGDNREASGWTVVDKVPVTGSFHGRTPDPWTKSPYWFVECDREIIKDHGDIWSPKAMDTYAGLYRLAEMRRRD